MKQALLIMAVLLFILHPAKSQEFFQYFDGDDTSAYNSILVSINPDSSNIWQIGKPQKAIFDSAATFPNAIITDTINYYPSNNSSRFTCKVMDPYPYGIFVLQWMQKLDMDSGADGGIIEYSKDLGQNWQTIFDNNPYIYNFYGYDPANVDTLPNGEEGFTGTDSTWKNVWLCFVPDFFTGVDTILFRFTFLSDSINTNKEGWMIDNMIVYITLLHTSSQTMADSDYIKIYPNPTAGSIYIEAQKLTGLSKMDDVQLINPQGVIVDEWRNTPVKFYIDTKKYPSGLYYMRMRTSMKSENIPIVITNHE